MQISVPRQRILYVGDIGPGATSAYRFEALRRLGQEAQAFNIRAYSSKNPIVQRLRHRYPVGPLVTRVNRALVKTVEDFRPGVVWFDKPTVFTPQTMRAIRQSRAKIVFYVHDGPFGPCNYGGKWYWLQFMRTFRDADLHCVFRQADVPRYQRWRLPFVRTMLSFDPQMHFPAPPDFKDTERDREISYIGSPFGDRAAFLLKLAREHRLSVFINGDRWRRVLDSERLRFFTLGGYLADAKYREGIWRSKINLSFVTEESEEDIAHKAVEIAGCGGFLLALRTPGHQAIFDEDREAVFFSSVEECADKCRFYLGRPDLREAIAARGRERAVRCGYDNDTQLARVLNRLDGKED